jgi:hypothetical protein
MVETGPRGVTVVRWEDVIYCVIQEEQGEHGM